MNHRKLLLYNLKRHKEGRRPTMRSIYEYFLSCWLFFVYFWQTCSNWNLLKWYMILSHIGKGCHQGSFFLLRQQCFQGSSLTHPPPWGSAFTSLSLEEENIAGSVLLSGYLGKSRHLLRFSIYCCGIRFKHLPKQKQLQLPVWCVLGSQ